CWTAGRWIGVGGAGVAVGLSARCNDPWLRRFEDWREVDRRTDCAKTLDDFRSNRLLGCALALDGVRRERHRAGRDQALRSCHSERFRPTLCVPGELAPAGLRASRHGRARHVGAAIVGSDRLLFETPRLLACTCASVRRRWRDWR